MKSLLARAALLEKGDGEETRLFCVQDWMGGKSMETACADSLFKMCSCEGKERLSPCKHGDREIGKLWF